MGTITLSCQIGHISNQNEHCSKQFEAFEIKLNPNQKYNINS